MEAKKLENYSYEDYLNIDKTTPDSERYELIFGRIYAMSGASAKHQDLVLNIAFKLKQIQKNSNCLTRIAPFDLKLKVDNNINIVQPDIMLFCDKKELPCAVFEVLSPSTAYKDKGVKKDLYESAGILNYFIVDATLKTVDKFILKDGKYEYDRCYALGYDEGKKEEVSDDMFIECLNEKVNMKEFFYE